MKRSSRVTIRAIVVASAVAVLGLLTLVMWRSSQAIRSAAEEFGAEHEFQFVARPLPQAVNAGFAGHPARQPSLFRPPAFRTISTCLPDRWSTRQAGTLLHQYAVGRNLLGFKQKMPRGSSQDRCNGASIQTRRQNLAERAAVEDEKAIVGGGHYKFRIVRVSRERRSPARSAANQAVPGQLHIGEAEHPLACTPSIRQDRQYRGGLESARPEERRLAS